MTKTVRYRRASNRVKAEVRKAVRDFENRIATEVQTNPKGFLKYAIGNSTGSAAKAEVLNTFLTSVFTLEDQE